MHLFLITKPCIDINQIYLTFQQLVGGYPLFVNEKIAGGIGVGGGTEEQDCRIAEYIVSVFEELTK